MVPTQLEAALFTTQLVCLVSAVHLRQLHFKISAIDV